MATHILTGKKNLKWLVALLLLAVIILAVLELTNVTHFFHAPPIKVIKTAGKPLSQPKPDASALQSPSKKTPSTSSPIVGNGTAVDTHGQASAPTNSSQWIVAASGNITVKQPLVGNRVASGSVLSGSAKVNQVNYRLIDENVGVIAQGTLSVVNGNFSGTLQFKPQSNTGRLDVFSTEPNGAEINEVQITVEF